MAGFQRESKTVLHVDEDSNSAKKADESKPKQQRSASKTNKFDGSAKYRVKYNPWPVVLIVNLHLRIVWIIKSGDIFAKSPVFLLNLKVFWAHLQFFSLLGDGRSVSAMSCYLVVKISTPQ